MARCSCRKGEKPGWTRAFRDAAGNLGIGCGSSRKAQADLGGVGEKGS